MSGTDLDDSNVGGAGLPKTTVGDREAMRERHIRFSSMVSESFTVGKVLTKALVQSALDFWASRGLVAKVSPSYEAFEVSTEPRSVSFVVEGGTIWTTSFDSYKKTVNVTLTGSGGQTEVFVNMVLPGGLMSLRDREKAAILIQGFYDALDGDLK